MARRIVPHLISSYLFGRGLRPPLVADQASFFVGTWHTDMTGVHGRVAAALLAEMQDVRGSACFENSETECKFSECIRQGGVEAPVLWRRVAKYVLWKAEKSGRAEAGGFHLEDNGYVLRA